MMSRNTLSEPQSDSASYIWLFDYQLVKYLYGLINGFLDRRLSEFEDILPIWVKPGAALITLCQLIGLYVFQPVHARVSSKHLLFKH